MQSIKKGVGVTGKFDAKTDALGVSWYHNWFPSAEPGVAAEFVPMIWARHIVTAEILDHLRDGRFPALLTFNGPDSKCESNMPVEEAIELWPKLMDTGLRLGSPAPSEGHSECEWLDKFMETASSKNLRVDFMCLHSHPDMRNPDAHEELRRLLSAVHKRFGRPVWLTDLGSWNKSQEFTIDLVSRYMAKVLPILESLPFLERYAWFASYTNFGMWPDWHISSLFSFSGKLTPLGIQYRDFVP